MSDAPEIEPNESSTTERGPLDLRQSLHLEYLSSLSRGGGTPSRSDKSNGELKLQLDGGRTLESGPNGASLILPGTPPFVISVHNVRFENGLVVYRSGDSEFCEPATSRAVTSKRASEPLILQPLQNGMIAPAPQRDIRLGPPVGDREKGAEVMAGKPVVPIELARSKVEAILQNLSNENAGPKIKELVGLYKSGNAYAKEAVVSLLLADNPAVSAKWAEKFAGRKAGFAPDLSRLSEESRTTLRKELTGAMQLAFGSRTASSDEIAAVALSMDPDRPAHNAEARKLLSLVFNRGAAGEPQELPAPSTLEAAKETERGLQALHDALTVRGLKDPMFNVLFLEYVKAANSPNNIFVSRSKVDDIGRSFNNNVNEAIDKARKGDEFSIRLLSAIASGVGRANSLDNMRTVNTDVPGRTKTLDTERASRASRALVEVARYYPDLVISALTDGINGVISDQAMRLETLGKVVGEHFEPSKISPAALFDRSAGGSPAPKELPIELTKSGEARRALHAGLNSSSEVTRASAIRGMMAFASKWNSADIQTLADRPGVELARELATTVETISPAAGKELVGRLVDSLFSLNGDADVEPRVRATTAMIGALGRFADLDHLKLLSAFSGGQGLRTLERLSQLNSPELNDARRLAGQLQQTIGKTFLEIARNTLSEEHRSAAVEALTSREWSFQWQRDTSLKGELMNLVHSHGDSAALARAVAKVTSDAGKPELSTQFREAGVVLGDGKLNLLTDAAVRHYGRERVENILARIALFNALPAEARLAATSNSQLLPPNQRLDLTGKKLSQQTLVALPEETRKSIAGAGAVKPGESVVVKEPLSLSAAQFNRLPQSVRTELSGDGAFLRNDRSLTLPVNLNASTFNALPASLRKELTGSDALLKEPGKLLLTDRIISADDINALPAAVRAKITGSEDRLKGPIVPLDMVRGKFLGAAEFNELPPYLRKALSGSDRPLFEGERLEKNQKFSISADVFNVLPEATRAALRSTSDRIDAAQVLVLLSTGLLDASDCRLNFLAAEGASSLESRVDSLKISSDSDRRDSQEQLRSLRNISDTNLSRLRTNAGESAGALRVADLLGLCLENGSLGVFNAGVTGIDFERKHAGNQANLLSNARLLEAFVSDQSAMAAQSSLRFDRLTLATELAAHSRLVAAGKRDQADRLALSLFGRYGEQLANYAPAVCGEIVGPGASVLSRLHASGDAQFKTMPALPASGTPSGPLEALTLLRKLSPAPLDEQQFADTAPLRRLALTAIDQAPSVRKLQDVVKNVQDQMNVLQLEAKAQGTRHDSLIDDAKKRARIIRETLATFTDDDLRAIREVRQDLKHALATTGDGEIKDKKSRLELENRVVAINQMLQLVDKNEKLDLGKDFDTMQARFNNIKKYLHNNHTLAGLIDQEPVLKGQSMSLDSFGPFPKHYSDVQKVAELVKEYQQLGFQLAAQRKSGRERLEDLFLAVEKKDFSPDTFAKWASTDGVVLAVTLTVSAAAMAATFGAATPIVAAAIGAGVGIIANDGLRELQHKFGMREDASVLGDFLRGKEIEELDGTKRAMSPGKDVALVYAKELGLGTVMNFAGSELGGIIGGKLFKALADKSGATRQAILSQNREALKVLGQSVHQLEHSAVSPSLREFGKAFTREMLSQSGFSVADHLSRSGVNGAAHRLGIELEENNLMVGAAINVVLSAAHRSVSLKMQLGKALRSTTGDEVSAARTPPQRHEVVYQAESAAKEAAFIRDLELAGGKVHMTEKGFAMSIDGRLVNFSRATDGVSASSGTRETFSATWFDKPESLDWIDRIMALHRREELHELAARLKARAFGEADTFEMEKRRLPKLADDHDRTQKYAEALLESFGPDASAMRVLEDVRLVQAVHEPQLAEAVRLKRLISEAEAGRGRDGATSTNKRRLDEILQGLTPETRSKAEDLINRISQKVEPLQQAIEKYQKLRMSREFGRPASDAEKQAELDVVEAQRKLHHDQELSTLRIAFAAIRDVLPPGRFWMPTEGGRRVAVNVETGSWIAKSRVDDVINRMDAIGIAPKELLFINRLEYLGGATRDGLIVLRSKDSNYLMLAVYDHEAGHLYDFTFDACSSQYREMEQIYRNCLKAAAKPIHDRAVLMHDDVPGGPDELVKEIMNNPFGMLEPNKRARYYASREEQFAEMFAMYLHEQRARARGESPGFGDLVRGYCSSKDAHRADIIKHFQPLYEHLSKTFFASYTTRSDARARFSAVMGQKDSTAGRTELKSAFLKHGADSSQMRTALSEYTIATLKNAREALSDSMFARDHQLDPATFDPSKLEPELSRKYREYRAFSDPTYTPPADSPFGFSRAVREAFNRYRENAPVVEGLAKQRVGAELRDLAKTHLQEFIDRYAPGLAHDVHEKYLRGFNRFDSCGHLDEKTFSKLAYTMSEHEVLADLFTVYLDKLQGGHQAYRMPFKDLIKRSFDDRRANQLSNFPELFLKLERDVFPTFRRMPLENIGAP